MPTVDEIKTLVAADYRLRVVDLTGDRRGGDACEARHVAMSLAKTLTGNSLPAIGRLFGHRDHTTVWNAVRRIAKRQGAEPELAARIARLTALLGDDGETTTAMARAGAAAVQETLRAALAAHVAAITAAIDRDPIGALDRMAAAVGGLDHG
ncbi:MAG: hypothetical protein HQL34_10220 [Alphaproteobacteria bacterium]|nr:hypothetical protein [Alphaproteobacteria bacterium]